MNTIEDYDYITTFNYPSESNNDCEAETTDVVNRWLDDYGWI